MSNRLALGSLLCFLACAWVAGSAYPGHADLPDATRTGSAYPLHIEAGKRYLVDTEGRAFFLNGDTAWSLVAELTREEVDLYLEDRRRRGFNAVLLNVLEHHFATHAPNNRYGAAPFATPGDYSTPNERYFLHVDYVVRKAAENGILVLLAPSYLGFNGGNQGWYRDMVANGPAKLRDYGRFLGKRYRNYPNILWVHGGDFNPPDRRLVREIALGIRESDARSLHTAHGAPETAALQYWSGEPWLMVNNLYTRKPAYLSGSEEYGRSSMPFFLLEGRYENELDGTEQRVRAQAYQAVLSGAMGHVFGNNPIWHFSGPGVHPTPLTWQQSLDSRGARSMTYLKDLFVPRSWWTLEPDVMNAFLTSGLGNGHDRAAAARAGDRSFGIAYLPSVRTVGADLRQLAGPQVNALWYDPAAGTYSAVSGSPFSASGPRLFRPPGPNSSGLGDWILVLESLGIR